MPELPRIGDRAPPVGFVSDRFRRARRHRIIYDEPMLRAAPENAGFTGVTECGPNESGEAALRGPANEDRLPEGFLRRERLRLEATEPAAAKPATKPRRKPVSKPARKSAGEAGAGTGRRARSPAGRSQGAGSAAS